MELAKRWVAELDDYVIDLAWSPDGSVLAAASAAGGITLFSGRDGASLCQLIGHEGGANGAAWLSAGVLASGGADGAVKFWDPARCEHAASTPLGRAWVEPLAAHGELLAAACGRRLALLGGDGRVRAEAPEAPKTVSALAWKPGGALLAAAHFGGVRLIGPDGAVAREFAYNNGIHALAWSPDGKWLVSGNQDPSVHLWLPAQDEEFHMSGYEGKVRHLSFDHSCRWLATGGGRDACVWDCSGRGPEGREPAMFPHDGPVTALAFQRSHGLLASAAQDGSLHLWSPERRQPLRAAARLGSAGARLAWSPDDRILAIGTEKGALYVLDCGNN